MSELPDTTGTIRREEKQRRLLKALENYRKSVKLVRHELAKVIVGQEQMIDSMLIALYSSHPWPG